jgi:GTP cyclohydrolase II
MDVMRLIKADLETAYGNCTIACYDEDVGYAQDFAVIFGDVAEKSGVVTRIQSECITGHVFHSLSCDCNDQLGAALDMINQMGSGLVVYLRQEGRGVGLRAKLQAYVLQRQGFDTVDANLELGYDVDGRSYEFAARIIKDLRIASIKLISNNPDKAKALESRGITVESVLRIPTEKRPQNITYLKTKKNRLKHNIEI